MDHYCNSKAFICDENVVLKDAERRVGLLFHDNSVIDGTAFRIGEEFVKNYCNDALAHCATDYERIMPVDLSAIHSDYAACAVGESEVLPSNSGNLESVHSNCNIEPNNSTSISVPVHQRRDQFRSANANLTETRRVRCPYAFQPEPVQDFSNDRGVRDKSATTVPGNFPSLSELSSSGELTIELLGSSSLHNDLGPSKSKQLKLAIPKTPLIFLAQQDSNEKLVPLKHNCTSLSNRKASEYSHGVLKHEKNKRGVYVLPHIASTKHIQFQPRHSDSDNNPDSRIDHKPTNIIPPPLLIQPKINKPKPTAHYLQQSESGNDPNSSRYHEQPVSGNSYSVFSTPQNPPDSRDIKLKTENIASDDDRTDKGSNSSYYLNNFLQIISTISANSHFDLLFNSEDRSVLDMLHSLPADALLLYVRLFVRKHQWIKANSIKYKEIADIDGALTVLVSGRFVLDGPDDDLELVLSCLNAPSLRSVRDYLFPHKTSARVSVPVPKMIQEILLHIKSATCNGIGSYFSKKPDSSLYKIVLSRARNLLGKCYKLEDTRRDLFNRIVTLFNQLSGRSHSNQAFSELSFEMLQISRGEILMPKYEISRQSEIFCCRESFKQLGDALNLEATLIDHLDARQWLKAVDIHFKARRFLDDQKNSTTTCQCSANQLPDFLHRFRPAYVYYRVLSRSIEALEKTCMHEVGYVSTELRFLLNQSVYGEHKRGYWWDRFSLNFATHLKRPKDALTIINEALKDELLHESYYLLLKNRLQALQKTKRNLAKAESSSTSLLTKGIPVNQISATSLGMDLPGSKNQFVLEDSISGTVEMVNVERAAIQHYVDVEEFTNAIHGEGSTFSTLFMVLFWNEVFLPLPDVFQTAFQSFPLDMNSKLFYKRRSAPLNSRFHFIETATDKELCTAFSDIWNEKFNTRCALLNWKRFESLKQACSLLRAIGGLKLSIIFKRIVSDLRQNLSGMPDLVVWNDTNFRLVEVKGPGDVLSPKQSIWLNYLTKHNIPCEVCQVKSSKYKQRWLKPISRPAASQPDVVTTTTTCGPATSTGTSTSSPPVYVID